MLNFTFDPVEHVYAVAGTGERLPNITGLLERDGLIDTEWFTEESRIRGSAVHRLTADVDLGALEDVHSLAGTDAKYSGWVQAHIKAMSLIRPARFTHIEVPMAHEHWRFAGTPDRGAEVYGALSIIEIKSGDHEPAHEIQTALQAILFEQEWGIPAESIQRFGLYLKSNGKFKFQPFERRSDFDRARTIIHKYCAVQR